MKDFHKKESPILGLAGSGGGLGYLAGGGVLDSLYVDDVFSTHLYDGNASTQTITNGIDLSAEGGLLWIKNRTFADENTLFNTESGPTKYLMSHSTASEQTNTCLLYTSDAADE